MINLVCSYEVCGKSFTQTPSRYNDRLKRNPNHKPYCTASCAHKDAITSLEVVCKNPTCGKHFKKQKARFEKNPESFCSQSCAAIFHNKERPIYGKCIVCEKTVNLRYKTICSLSCIKKNRYTDYIDRWKHGLEDGVMGLGGISIHIRRYLYEKYESKCCQCGWDKVHPITKRKPLQVEHIDGNWRNNQESNLLLLCPNCHSLTLTFGSLNRGQGRRTNGGWYK